MLDKIKYKVAKLLDANISLSHKIYGVLPHIPMLLPHDQSYHAFRLYPRNRVILDIGANNGISALSLHKLFPNAQIISFEPNPQHKDSLIGVQRKISSFSFRLLGLGAQENMMPLYIPYKDGQPLHTASSVDASFLKAQLSSIGVTFDDVEVKQEEIKIVPLDSLNILPDLIKIDAEGYELEILKGARETLKRARPMVLTEYSSPLKGDQHRLALQELLHEIDYQAFSYDPGTHSLLPFSDAAYAATTGARNIVLIHAEEI